MPYYHAFVRNQLPGVLGRIRDAVYTPVAPLAVTVRTTREPVPFGRRLEGEARELRVGDRWGELWDCGWFLFEGTLPEAARDLPVVLRIDISGEACAVDEAGTPVRGLTTYASEFDLTHGRPGKTELPWAPRGRPGDRVLVWADGACNDLFGKYQDSGTLKRAEIATVCEPMRGLYYDFEVLADLLAVLPETSARHHQILAALGRASALLDRMTPGEAEAARSVLAPVLSSSGGDPALTVSAVGHAHIDLAWLWPIRETIRKGARTFSTALANLQAYPDYVFGASQPQLYQWVKDHYPGLYAQIGPQVAAGRWEAQGGMWVEPDTNLAGGEALVRQLLYGIRFFQKEFGVTPRMLWLPDVFGYTGSLPQILKLAGIDWFMTTKLSWNKFNKMPHHTFHWKGIDGSSVLAHMPPEGTYNSAAAPRTVAAAEREYRDKAVSDRCLLVYGIGDGGGGPGEEHLERLAREKDLQGIAPVRQEGAEAFFGALEERASEYPSWQGELYFEMHQGTYTTQGRNKRANRLMEARLRDSEFLAAFAAVRAGVPYPREELEAVWKEVLLYQFHDILPGSSIGRVYDESLARYAALEAQLEALDGRIAGALGSAPEPAWLNSLPWDRTEWVRDGQGWAQVRVPALSFGVPEETGRRTAAETRFPLGPEGTVLENSLVRVRFDASGALVSVADRTTGDEYLDGRQGPANRFEIWRDDGDAWDFSPEYRSAVPGLPGLVSAEAFRDGPVSGLRTRHRWGSSTIDQEIRLTEGSARIDFATTVDWQERGRMLRVVFPTVLDVTEAEAEIPFGALRRPTCVNTSWDAARYEVCAHRWINLSRADAGAALLNNGKYGHLVRGGTIDLNLLRSPSYPDPEADRGTHRFTYAFLPHRGSGDRTLVAREAWALNQPLRTFGSGAPAGTPGPASLFRVSRPEVLVEAVKVAEDSRSVVLRLFESTGARCPGVRIEPGFAFTRAVRTDLLEQETDAPLRLAGSAVEADFGPYQIVTLKFDLGPAGI